jgi:aldose 1-epimerase
MTSPELSAVRLSAGPLTLELRPELGGAVTRFVHESTSGALDIFRPTTRAALVDRDILGAASFALVPFSNRIENGRFRFGDQSYRMAPNMGDHPHPLHGHGWRSVWRVVEQSSASASLRFEYDGDEWPSAYSATQTLSLSADALAVTLVLRNEGDRDMPAGIGLHPYFPKTARTRLSAELERVWFGNADCIPTELGELPNAWQFHGGRALDGVELDHCFTGWQRRALVEWPEKGLALEIAAEPPLSYAVIYVPKGRDFFCFEPVSHENGALNPSRRPASESGLQVLAPGADLKSTVHFRVRRD